MRYPTHDRRTTPRPRVTPARHRWGYGRLFVTVVLLSVLAACSSIDIEPIASEEMPELRITMAGGSPADVSASDAIPVVGVITASIDAPAWMGAVTFHWNERRSTNRIASAPFETQIDSTEFADGPHTIYADLYQRNGRVRATIEATIIVANDAPADGVPTPDDGNLTWAPPVLVNPITLNVPVAGGVLTLDTSRDYRLVMPSQPVTGPFAFNGGRNVVLIGGEINIGWQGSGATTETKRRGMFIRNSTGVVHIEGLLMRGDDLGEGFHISAPNATVQIQNVRVWGIHARDYDVNFTEAHPDLIQTWGNVGALRVDGLTGSSDYQGIFLKADFNGQHGPVDLRRVNIHGDTTSRYLFWMSGKGGDYPTVRLEDMYINYAASRTMANAVWPDARHATHPASIRLVDGRFQASWATLPVTGFITSGAPPAGDFVGPNDAGIGYVTPGYD